MKNLTGVIITDYYDGLTERSIRSLIRICDEIILVESENIRGKFFIDLEKNKKIKRLKQKFKLNHSELRNAGLTNVKTEWVLFLDSDEVLSEDLIKEIPSLITNKDIEGYWFSRRNYISHNKYLKYGLFYPDFQLRLFQFTIKYCFYDPIHPHIDIPEENTLYKNIDILHYPRHSKYTKFSDFVNFIPYIRIESKELIKTQTLIPNIIFVGVWKWIDLFFSGFFRGKGFLDGWAGFRAHVLFASYISAIYYVAAYKKIMNKI